jgi:hypothetical protein
MPSSLSCINICNVSSPGRVKPDSGRVNPKTPVGSNQRLRSGQTKDSGGVKPKTPVGSNQRLLSGQTKDYRIGICCFSAKHAALTYGVRATSLVGPDRSLWFDLTGVFGLTRPGYCVFESFQ